MISSPLVIFDCDGLLVDSEFIACKIEAEELTRIGYALSPEECIRGFVENARKLLWKQLKMSLVTLFRAGSQTTLIPEFSTRYPKI